MFELKWPPLKIGDIVRVNDRGMGMYPEIFSEKICGEIVAIIDGVHIGVKFLGVKFPAGSIEGHYLDGIISEDSGWWLLEEYVDPVSSAEESGR